MLVALAIRNISVLNVFIMFNMFKTGDKGKMSIMALVLLC
jgi:hypothetical protein